MGNCIERFLDIVTDRLCIASWARHPTDVMCVAVIGINMVKADGSGTNELNLGAGKELFVDSGACANDENIGFLDCRWNNFFRFHRTNFHLRPFFLNGFKYKWNLFINDDPHFESLMNRH